MSARYKKIGFACAMVLITACGSSGSSGTSTTTGTTTGTASATDLTLFSTIPDMNLDSLDAATNAESASVSARMMNTESGPSADFQELSIDGCISQAMVGQAKGEMKAFERNKCMMEAVEANTAFAIPLDHDEYYEMTMPGGPGDQGPPSSPQGGDGPAANEIVPPTVRRIKVGLVDGVLRLALCEKNESGDFAQKMSFSAQITADGLFNTQMISEHHSPFEDVSARSRLSATLESDDLALLTADKPAVLEGQFSDGQRGGIIKVTVGRDENDFIFNRVEGHHQFVDAEHGSGHDAAFGQFNHSGGCTTHDSSGEAPARTVEQILPPGDAVMAAAFAAAGYGLDDKVCYVKVEDFQAASFPADFFKAATEDGTCTYENSGTACYAFEDNTDGGVDAFVSPPETAPYSNFVSANSETLDNESPLPIIEFVGDDFWDCSAPVGSSFQTINFAGNIPLMEATMACHEEFKDDRRPMDSCFDQHNKEEAEDKAGTDFNDSPTTPPVEN